MQNQTTTEFHMRRHTPKYTKNKQGYMDCFLQVIPKVLQTGDQIRNVFNRHDSLNLNADTLTDCSKLIPLYYVNAVSKQFSNL